MISTDFNNVNIIFDELNKNARGNSMSCLKNKSKENLKKKTFIRIFVMFLV